MTAIPDSAQIFTPASELIIRKGEGDIVVFLDGKSCTVTEAEALALKQGRLLDGRLTLGRLAEEAPLIAGLLPRFLSAGMAWKLPRTDRSVSAVHFGRYVEDRVQGWRLTKEDARWPWRSHIRSGAASEAYLRGIILENLHFVRAATWKQATAVIGTMAPAVYDLFKEKISDECQHEQLFFESLRRWGYHLTPESLPDPLPSTTIFIALQRSIGLEGVIPYIASSTVLEASADLVQRDGGPYAAWSKTYQLDQAIFEPITRHIQEDAESGHGNLLSTALKWYDWLSIDIARAAYRAAWSTFEGTRVWQRDMYEAYESGLPWRPYDSML